ncbi:hypothetical protein ACFO25_03765 [Paenactinomyces guangxiensis]|uniref:Uncharacterized protein n=1 Tax=Paenactinomyces guangxiensis TaxID=1490290 RepID=A0A7W2A971_9BACL|nr:hypothetical protein [Paenactinomyces guangxiensis]MBA4494882.1 hypothetical protein [Paenactinomyces guangxiensis]MBH8591965.1 hypothetical protein [Paenactinomyces guangxiensis]
MTVGYDSSFFLAGVLLGAASLLSFFLTYPAMEKKKILDPMNEQRGEPCEGKIKI